MEATVTKEVKVEVDYRHIVIMWLTGTDEEIIHTLCCHGGIRRYQLSIVDPRLMLARKDMLPYFFSPATAMAWMRDNKGEQCQVEWRSHENIMRDCGEISWGYVDYFDREDTVAAFGNAVLEPFSTLLSQRIAVNGMRGDGKDPSILGVKKIARDKLEAAHNG